MKKKIIYLLFIFVILFSCSGCIKNDVMQGIDIVTTIYPIDYITNRLYGDDSNITSIYPKGTIVNEYKLTNKMLRDYSEKDLFIYNGNTSEKEYAKDMLGFNKKLKIIDASYGIDSTYKDSDVWLNPSNILMVAQNIRNELSEYINSSVVIDSINNKYDLLKVDITELESEIKKAAESSNLPTIVVYDESLNYLNKYGFKVINLTENGKTKQSNIDVARALYDNKKISYVFVIENEKISDDIENFIKKEDAEKLTIRSLDNIKEEDVSNNDDYLSLMHYNLDLIKKETYK